MLGAQKKPQGDERLLNPYFAVCLFMPFVYMVSFNMTIPLIANYVVALGHSTAMGGFVAGMFSLFALVFRPLVGFVADHVDKKGLLMGGCVIAVASFVGYACAPNVAMLVAFRILHALALCIQTTVLAVVATGFVPTKRLGEGVGYVGIAATLGLAIGPSLGVLIADCAGLRAVFWGSASAMALTVFLLVPLPSAAKQRRAQHVRITVGDLICLDALPLSVAVMSFAFCAGLTTSLIVLLGSERAIEGVTLFFFISSIGMVAARPFAGRIVDRKGLAPVLLPSFVFECVAMMCVAFAHSLACIIAAALFRIVGQGVAQISLQGQILKDAPEEHRGVAASTFYMGVDVGQGFGAMAGGWVADAWGYTAAYATGPVLLAMGFLAYLFWRKKVM